MFHCSACMGAQYCSVMGGLFSCPLSSSGRGRPLAGTRAALPDAFRPSPASGSGRNRNAPGTGPGGFYRISGKYIKASFLGGTVEQTWKRFLIQCVTCSTFPEQGWNRGVFCSGTGGLFSCPLSSSGRGRPLAGTRAALPDAFRPSPASGSGRNRNAPETGPGGFYKIRWFMASTTAAVSGRK